MKRIEIYDTTLRDGTQAEHISLSLNDKLDIAARLDELGVDFIEGGWPGSNPKDEEFFAQASKTSYTNARIAAFGSTRHAKNTPETDPNLLKLVSANVPVITIFGKSWDFHVTDALRVELGVNLEMIESSIAYLKKNCDMVIYDAEHFFDGFKANQEYALSTLQAAVKGGAERLALCDTNGGCLPWEISNILSIVQKHCDVPIGIHTHNDCGSAVANALSAVNAGAIHVQGTINGIGERTGNCDLISVIPNLMLKMDCECLIEGQLQHLTEVSRYVYELANLPWRDDQPFVGRSAFAHKGGIHVSAVQRNPKTYEHVTPESVGNARRILISELSGRSNILDKLSSSKFLVRSLEAADIEADKQKDAMLQIRERIQDLENEGYEFECAEASFELLVLKILNLYKSKFDLSGFRVIMDGAAKQGEENTGHFSEASIRIKVGNDAQHTAAEGDGPVDALNKALRKALGHFYPAIDDMILKDFKVRVVNPAAAAEAKVRVIIESSDGERRWSTIGVSDNIIEASWIALVDSMEYKIIMEELNDD